LKVNDENGRIQDPDPDPLVRGMDPRIRIHTKMSWIRNTGNYFVRRCDYMFACYLGGAEGELPDEASGAQLVGAQLLEAGHDPTASGDGNQLDLWAAHPSRRKENALQRTTTKKQVIFYNSLNFWHSF
jgi:hypothetical protein